MFKLISMINGRGISCEIVHRRMSMDLTGDESTLVQVMVWCHQATGHYLNQCWFSYMTPYDLTRPQCVNHGPNWYTRHPCTKTCHYNYTRIPWRHMGVSYHQQFDCLFNMLFILTTKKIEDHYWYFFTEPVAVSTHEGPVMRDGVPCLMGWEVSRL